MGHGDAAGVASFLYPTSCLPTYLLNMVHARWVGNLAMAVSAGALGCLFVHVKAGLHPLIQGVTQPSPEDNRRYTLQQPSRC